MPSAPSHPSLQTVFVTGASAGFGKAIAERLVKEGYRVIAAARRTERLVELQAQYGDRLLPLTLDMTDFSALRGLPETLPEGWREIDVLINNAGLALGMEPAQTVPVENWTKMIATNVSGLAEITHALLPAMVARNHGYIISMGSTAGTYPYKGGNIYGATKAFVAQFMQNLRTDLLGTSLRVTIIAPGLCGGTEFSQVRLHDKAKAEAVYAGTQPLTAEDMAETVSWLLRLPPHMNVNHMEIMPVCQASGGLAVVRETT